MNGKNIVLLTTGLLIGSVGGFFAGYYLSKNKYLNIAEKEIASVKKVYEKHFNKSEEAISAEPVKANVPNKSIPAPLVDPEKDKYQNYAGMYGKESSDPKGVPSRTSIDTPKIPKKTKPKSPHVITPEEFRDSEFEAETLIWYSDKILSDSDGRIIHNPNEIIGPEALSTFGRYMDDTVYVRDEDKKLDYEIIWDARKYSSVHRSGDGALPSDDD